MTATWHKQPGEIPCFRGVLLDLDGVIESDAGVEAGAKDFISALIRRNIKFVIVTNDIRAECYSRISTLHDAGLPIDGRLWVTPYDALVRELQTLGCVQPRFFGCDAPPNFGWLRAKSDHVDSIVLGDIRDSEEHFEECRSLVVQDLPFFALQKNLRHLKGDSFASDVGYFVAMWESRLARRAQTVGKPGPTIYRLGMELIGCTATETAMVSDSLSVDLAGALEIGVTGILLTKYAHPDDINLGCESFRKAESLSEVGAILGL